VPETSAFEFEMAIEKLKRYKSPGIDQIPAELIKAGGSKICSDIHKPINYILKIINCLSSGSSQSFYLFTRRAIKQTVVIIEAYQFCQLPTEFYPNSFSQG
jgi:tRNA A58 N-methylase Trm61